MAGVRRLTRVLLFGIAAVVIVAAGFFALSQTLSVYAANEQPPLNCLSCHNKVLKGHDKLGSGSEACWACHVSTQMKTLHLAGGETQFPRSDSPRLCGQCHQKRYEAWKEGIHGVLPLQEGDTEIRSTEKAKCVSCHNPHQPQVVFSDITRPHPEPTPAPPTPPTDLLLMLGISLALLGVIVVVIIKGEVL